MSLTFRRVDPAALVEMDDETAAMFAFGLSQDGQQVDGDDVIPFFAPWHIVHFLSSGTEWEKDLPSGFVLGGSYWRTISPEEEPPRLLSPDEVSSVHRHLSFLAEDVLDARLIQLSQDQATIYGGPVPLEARGQVLAAFEMIKCFFGQAVDAKQGVLMTMA